MIKKYLIPLIILFIIASCKKEEDCLVYTDGYIVDRRIPDSVSIDSNIVIGVLWKRQNNCEVFEGFTTYPYELSRIYLDVVLHQCDCNPDTTVYVWKDFIFDPDTVGSYPVEINCSDGIIFSGTVVVY